MKNIVILIIVFVIGIICLVLGLVYSNLELKDFLQDVILWFTAIVLIWYTFETYNLRKIAQKQDITSIRPYLRLQRIEGIDDKLRLVNEGKGVAVNLHLKYKKNNGETPKYAVTAMAPGPSSYTDIYRNGIGLDSEEGLIEVRYRDIEDRMYIVLFKPNNLFNDRFEIKKQEEDKSRV